MLDAGFLKIDLLGLGMLSAVEDCVDRVAHAHGRSSTSYPLRRSRGLRGDPARGHGRRVPDREPRADAQASCANPGSRRPHCAGRARPPGADPGRRCTRTSTPGSGCGQTPPTSGRSTTSSCASRCVRPYGVVVFQDQVLEVAIAFAGFTVGEAEGLRRAMSRKRSHDALEAYRGRFVAGAAERAWTPRPRTASSTSSSASFGRRRTRPRSGCSRTSRSGCGGIHAAGSCARS